jgi:hypothetical protein
MSPVRSKCEPGGAWSQPFVRWNTDVQRSAGGSDTDAVNPAPPASSAVYIGISSAVSGGCPSARKRLREPNGRFVEVYASSRRRVVRFLRCVCASTRSRVDCARRCRARSRVRCRSAMIPRALSARSSEVRDRSVPPPPMVALGRCASHDGSEQMVESGRRECAGGRIAFGTLPSLDRYRDKDVS